MGDYKVVLTTGTEVVHTNILNLEITDRTITGTDEKRDIVFVYPVNSILSLTKI